MAGAGAGQLVPSPCCAGSVHTGQGQLQLAEALQLNLITFDLEMLKQWTRPMGMQAAQYLWPNWGSAAAGDEAMCQLLQLVEEAATEQFPALVVQMTEAGTFLSSFVRGCLEHCFMTVLQEKEVCHFLALSLVMGPDWQLYFTLAVLHHMTLSTRNPTPVSSNTRFPDCLAYFRAAEHLPFMLKLQSSYQDSFKHLMGGIHPQGA